MEVVNDAPPEDYLTAKRPRTLVNKYSLAGRV